MSVKPKIKMRSNRNLGLVFFVFFLVLGIWPITNDGEIRIWSIFISLSFLTLSLIKSKILTPLNILWFKMNNIKFINSMPESSPFYDIKRNIFEKSSKATFIERILQQFIMIFSSMGGEGGIFLFVGKKIN